MPLYRCTIPAGKVRHELRPRVAKEFTRIHSELTGAPPGFVHVHFVDVDGGTPPDAPSCGIHGTIRAGRTTEVTSLLVDQLTTALAEFAEVTPRDVTMSLTEVPASWIMEGGEIAPEPGAEAQWPERHSRPA